MNDDGKADEGLDTLTADDKAPPSAAPPATHPSPDAAGKPGPSVREAATEIGRGAIRGAYLARRLTIETEGVGAAEHEAIAVSTLVRGAYVAHLATPDSGSAGEEHAGTTQLLRGIYAARVTAAGRSAATAPPRVRLGKAKKAAPRKSAATKAKKAAPPRRAKKKAAGRAKASRRASGKRGHR
ncbi:MAG TPA: hypothetical protein VGU20_30835 [Stellaceae bacterium]|nr:hypothetical protein [Stellaceae bacterium]